MENNLIDQLNFVRLVTLHTVKDLSEKDTLLIPEGFNNNIVWNLGHLYLVQEKFAFNFAQEPMQKPAGFTELFDMGTKPSQWSIKPPTLPELLDLLKEQPNRIRARLENRLEETVKTPFSIPGLTLKTFGQLLSFNLYHEGIHIQAIRTLRRIIER